MSGDVEAVAVARAHAGGVVGCDDRDEVGGGGDQVDHGVEVAEVEVGGGWRGVCAPCMRLGHVRGDVGVEEALGFECSLEDPLAEISGLVFEEKGFEGGVGEAGVDAEAVDPGARSRGRDAHDLGAFWHCYCTSAPMFYFISQDMYRLPRADLAQLARRCRN